MANAANHVLRLNNQAPGNPLLEQASEIFINHRNDPLLLKD